MLTDRELATVLAALRMWQDYLIGGDPLTDYPEHFEDHAPLTEDQVEALCERLNVS